MCEPLPIIRSPTARSNAGTKPSRASASASRCRCRSTTRDASSPITSTHYNHVRLHSAIGYVTPKDKLLGNDAAIHAERDRKLAEARERRKQMRQTRHEQIEAHADSSRPAIDFAAVRAAITIAQVLTLLGFVPRSDHAGQQRGACPLHGSTQRHRSLLQRQHQRPHLPLLQVQPLRQRPGPVGRRQPPVDLRCRPRPVPTPEHPAADPGAAANREQRRGTRSLAVQAPVQSPERFKGCHPLVANSNTAIFQFRLNHHITMVGIRPKQARPEPPVTTYGPSSTASVL